MAAMQDNNHDNLDLDGLKAIAEDLARQATPRDVFFLNGTLGAGKTQFAKFFINALSQKPITVQSPTFTLVQFYDFDTKTVSHFDLYRVEDPSELEAIGFFDALQNDICLIEWPEKCGNFAPKKRTDIAFTINADETRTLKITHMPTKKDETHD